MYSRENLIGYIKKIIIESIKYGLTDKTRDVNIISQKITKDSLIFGFNNGISNLNEQASLSELNIRLGGINFEGTLGKYSFGNIYNNSKFKYQNKSLLSIGLPFFKLETIYLDIVPIETIPLILRNLVSKHDVSEVMRTFVPFNRVESIYEEIIRIRFPRLFKYLKIVINDMNSENRRDFTWDNIYRDIHKFKDGFDVYDLFKLEGYLGHQIALLIPMILILKEYPIVYNKIKNIIDLNEWDELYDELKEAIKEYAWDDYIKTGKISSDYKLKIKAVKEFPGPTIYIVYMMLKDGVLFESRDDYLFVVAKTIIEIIYHFRGDYELKIKRFLDDINFNKNDINDLINKIFNVYKLSRSRPAAIEIINQYRLSN